MRSSGPWVWSSVCGRGMFHNSSHKVLPIGHCLCMFPGLLARADLGHGVANPVLVLEGLDFSLDEVTEMLAGHLGGCWCPGVGYMLELQWGF